MSEIFQQEKSNDCSDANFIRNHGQQILFEYFTAIAEVGSRIGTFTVTLDSIGWMQLEREKDGNQETLTLNQSGEVVFAKQPANLDKDPEFQVLSEAHKEYLTFARTLLMINMLYFE